MQVVDGGKYIILKFPSETVTQVSDDEQFSYFTFIIDTTACVADIFDTLPVINLVIHVLHKK